MQSYTGGILWIKTSCRFQYRKRYKGACNMVLVVFLAESMILFQYRKRYKGACNLVSGSSFLETFLRGFNTVNGIRVHAIKKITVEKINGKTFQYRKRYKGACNSGESAPPTLNGSFNTVNGIRVHAITTNTTTQYFAL